MKFNFLTVALGTALIVSPSVFAQQKDDAHPVIRDSDGLREAIAFQRAKDRADQRQAHSEQRRPSVDYSRTERKPSDTGKDGRRLVSDPGPGHSQQVKK